MTETTNCSKINNVKSLLSYLNKHHWQARMVVGALSLGFVIAVTFVGYAVLLQAKHGCLTIFTSK